jgi:hypothetical protein
MTARLTPETALIEAVAKGIFEARHKGLRNCWRWEDSGLDDEHPGARDAYIRDARAALAVISAAIRAAAKEILGEDKP